VDAFWDAEEKTFDELAEWSKNFLFVIEHCKLIRLQVGHNSPSFLSEICGKISDSRDLM
jgi:hypothetical protein